MPTHWPHQVISTWRLRSPVPCPEGGHSGLIGTHPSCPTLPDLQLLWELCSWTQLACLWLGAQSVIQPPAPHLTFPVPHIMLCTLYMFNTFALSTPINHKQTSLIKCAPNLFPLPPLQGHKTDYPGPCDHTACFKAGQEKNNPPKRCIKSKGSSEVRE